MSRLKKVRKNAMWGIINGAVTASLMFLISRQILISYGDEYNGLIGIIINIIGYLTIMDAGIGIIGSLKLYIPISIGDFETISIIYFKLRRTYRMIAIFILIGIISFAIIARLLMTFEHISMLELFAIIVLYGSKTIMNYFISSARTVILNTNQEKYLLDRFNIFFNIVTLGTILIMMLTKINFIVILSVWLLFVTIQSISHYIICYKKFPKIDNRFYKQKPYISEIKPMLVHRVSASIVNSTDALTLGILTNMVQTSTYVIYFSIKAGIDAICQPFISGTLHSFGDLIASKNGNDDIYDLFYGICNVMGVLISAAVVSIVPIFISVAFGANYAQTFNISIILGLLILINYSTLGYETIISAAGLFNETKKYVILEAVLNIVLSVTFVLTVFKNDPIMGVLAATIISTIIKVLLNYKIINKTIGGTIKSIKIVVISLVLYCLIFSTFLNKKVEFNFKNINYTDVLKLMAPAFIFVTIYSLTNFKTVRKIMKLVTRKKV